MKPLISIIVPIFDTESHLKRCLLSILDQTLRDIEIICVDDCLPDNSLLIVEQLRRRDSRLKLIHHDVKKGRAGARNTAIRVAKADFITSVDSDDSIHPSMLQMLWEASENGKLDIICCGFNCVDSNGDTLYSRNFSAEIIDNTLNTIDIFSAVYSGFFNKLWRKSLFSDNNIFFPEKISFQDIATIPLVLSKSNSIKIIEDNLYSYSVKPDPEATMYCSNHIVDYFLVFGILLRFFEGNNLLDHYRSGLINLIGSSMYLHSVNLKLLNQNEKELKQSLLEILIFKTGFLNDGAIVNKMDRAALLVSLGGAKSKQDLLSLCI